MDDSNTIRFRFLSSFLQLYFLIYAVVVLLSTWLLKAKLSALAASNLLIVLVPLLSGIDPAQESMPSNAAFQLHISISRQSNGDPVSYKVDGGRFEGGSRTLKFATNTQYKLTLTSKPPAEFHSMHLAGSDLQLHTDDPKNGEYTTEWNTTGIDVCKKGDRNNVGLTLQGPGGLLKRKLQCKFYEKDDAHADYGTKLEFIEWACAVDGSGTISVTEENIR